MRVQQRVGSETSNIESTHEGDEMLLPTTSSTSATTTFPSDDSGIASTGPTATIPREFVSFADAVGAKPPSKPAFWSSYTSMSTGVRATVFTYQVVLVELDVTTHVIQGRGVTVTLGITGRAMLGCILK
jgi:hypothetical protein